MKKYLTSILCIAIMLSVCLSIVLYAEEQPTDLQPIWIETFDGDDAASKYVSTAKYTASVADGVLTLNAKNNSHRDIYRLSGDDGALSGKTKLTFAYSFKPDSLHAQASIFASFGHTENKAYIAGVQRLTGNSCLVYGHAVEGDSKGTLTTTQHYIMTPFADGTPSSANVEFPTDSVITMIIEVDNNAATVCSMYIDGVKVGVAGDAKDGGKYNASTDAEKTMDGHFGMCVPTSSTAIKVGAYAIYDGTGLDHEAIMKQVYNEADFKAAEDTDNTNTPDTDNTNTPDTDNTNTPDTDNIDTQPNTDKVDDNTENNDQDTTLETKEDEKSGGCSSSLGITAIAVVGIVGFAGVAFRKKERR